MAKHSSLVMLLFISLIVSIGFPKITTAGFLEVFKNYQNTVRVGVIPTSITELISTPRKFSGKIVSVEGEVKSKTGLILRGAFVIQKDGTTLIVWTKRPLPKVGSSIQVIGEFKTFPLGDTVKYVILED